MDAEASLRVRRETRLAVEGPPAVVERDRQEAALYGETHTRAWGNRGWAQEVQLVVLGGDEGPRRACRHARAVQRSVTAAENHMKIVQRHRRRIRKRIGPLCSVERQL